MDRIIIGLLVINLLLLLVVLIKSGKKHTALEDGAMEKTIQQSVHASLGALGTLLQENQQQAQQVQQEKLEQIRQTMKEKLEENQLANHRAQEALQQTFGDQFRSQSQQLSTFSEENRKSLESIRGTVEAQLKQLQGANDKKLEEMRQTVDEKLQKTLEERMNQSFRLVSERLEQVYKGLGEMQTLANGVGDLKKVLSNVKTRGILGEIQLGAILAEILAPEQYEQNVVTKKGSRQVVEFAVKIPTQQGESIFLPIDSKFPGDTYQALLAAYDTGDSAQVAQAAKQLKATIKAEAKDIRDKYIDPPNTTEFAILFLPFEGLYAEAVNRGLVEELQKEYHVNLAGPSTMAALLNSLQMGFRAFAIQKRSSEVWQVLGAVKTEFDTFAKVLENTKKRLDQANGELDALIGVRTRQIQRKLAAVEKLETAQAEAILGEEEA